MCVCVRVCVYPCLRLCLVCVCVCACVCPLGSALNQSSPHPSPDHFKPNLSPTDRVSHCVKSSTYGARAGTPAVLSACDEVLSVVLWENHSGVSARLIGASPHGAGAWSTW